MLGCWRNNSANSHPSPGAFDCRVQSSCLVQQCLHLPHWPCHQQCFAHCDWMPVSYTSGQPSNPRRHPTCWASLQWSHTVSSTTCHWAWTPAPLTARLSIQCRYMAPQIETPICVPAAQQLISSSDKNSVGVLVDHKWNAEWADYLTRLWIFIPDTSTFPPRVTRAWLWLDKLRNTAARFHSCLCKWVWFPLRSVSVALKNKLSTMLSFNVQSINHLIITVKPNWAMFTFGDIYLFALFDVLNIAHSF